MDQAHPRRDRPAVDRERSAIAAAVLSFIFPGLGQAYLGNRRMALVFAAPVLLLLVLLAALVLSQGGLVRLGVRAFDPAVAFPSVALLLALGLWWIVGILHAWRSTGTRSVAPFVVALALVLIVGSVDVWGALSIYRIGQAGAQITDPNRDPTAEANRPSPRPSPTPMPPGVTPDPAATPTQRPPDYVDPSEEPSDEPDATIAPGPTPSFDIGTIDASDDGYLNVMLAGLDWIEGRSSARTDTILVVSVNNSSGEVVMISFPRDLQTFPIYNGGTFEGKINSFARVSWRYRDKFAEPGIPALAEQVGFMIGSPIDYYASVNMSGFLEVIETVGAVTVCNPREIADDNLQFYLAPGRHRLGPADALRFVRSRKGQSGGDFARARRQQEVLSALKREMLKPENLTRIPDIAEALADVISTNYPPSQLDQLLTLAEQVEDEPSQTWILKNPYFADLLTRRETGGRQRLVPRMERLAELSKQIFGEASLYWDGKPLGTPVPADASPSPDPSGVDNPC